MLSENAYALGANRSCIRDLFEYGCQRAALVGRENVYDYSLGNPSIPSPPEVNQAVRDILADTDSLLVHGYTSAVGDYAARKAISDDLNARYGAETAPEDFFLGCGAAPELVAVFRALAVPGGELLAVAPYFPEYKPFAQEAGLTFRVVPPDVPSFQIIVVRRAQESIAIGHDFEQTFSIKNPFKIVGAIEVGIVGLLCLLFILFLILFAIVGGLFFRFGFLDDDGSFCSFLSSFAFVFGSFASCFFFFLLGAGFKSLTTAKERAQSQVLPICCAKQILEIAAWCLRLCIGRFSQSFFCGRNFRFGFCICYRNLLCGLIICGANFSHRFAWCRSHGFGCCIHILSDALATRFLFRCRGWVVGRLRSIGIGRSCFRFCGFCFGFCFGCFHFLVSGSVGCLSCFIFCNFFSIFCFCCLLCSFFATFGFVGSICLFGAFSSGFAFFWFCSFFLLRSACNISLLVKNVVNKCFGIHLFNANTFGIGFYLF